MTVSSTNARKRLRTILEAAQPGRIVVHAGRVKTGSTFLQAALLENAERLRESGWLFPRSLMHFGKIQPKSRVMRSTGHAILSRIAGNIRVDAKQLVQFERELAGTKNENLIFSAEVLGRDPREGMLSQVAPLLDGFDVTVCMYLRRPSAWTNSYYVESISGAYSRECRRFEDTSEDFRGAANVTAYLDQCRDWRTPPRVIFRNYEVARCSEGGILADFSRILGLPSMPDPEKTEVNRSPSGFVVHGVRIFNSLTRGLSGDEYRRLYDVLLKNLERHDDGRRGMFLSSEICREIDSHWALENRALVAGGHISQQHYDQLTESRTKDEPQIDLTTDARILREIFDLLQQNGVTGFKTEPTVSGVWREFQRRVRLGIRRRLSKHLGIPHAM